MFQYFNKMMININRTYYDKHFREILNYAPLEVITTQYIFQFLKAHSTNRILPTMCLLKIILSSLKREMNL
ncbi:hypothetical protein GLOIN_2v1640555 [Rhizophagus irregularis DAOM 181602=DAOM 197198]|uniref:Uncharacterized protein n=1 Tax=Rhizophagus irregularis (strain DAOM 181602 / DAOM 197198 / MUCL 43194) TaxID=747089 RepID=A0A2P4PRQ2_RHIID|nr:hypothetical protein GLOIN_2v1640555 [Rhizophagus irregularis DAOM 181602=DAOM 197198]POG68057.1 hypothetical protein GLOIN_2v1640555 [Rhizophagus irregularis DAOM 181602=DAOM 197198]|eukprot:XP_025174923.1 hypothetical protein GLOIN_2v1640555 [Rhizophagus irregularis DAOM 181602=DAOM 197198]